MASLSTEETVERLSLMEPEGGRPLRQLKWDENNHFGLITQLHGSVIPRVIPYCIVNSILTAIVYELKTRGISDLTSSPSGHKYLSVIMSFLLISRVKIIYDRYMHNSESLSNLLKACRDIIQWTVTFSLADKSERAKQWRHDVAYAVLVMLRVTMAVLEFQSDPSQVPWALADVHEDQTQEMQDNMFLSIFKINASKDDHDDDDGDNALHPPPTSLRQASAKSFLAHTASEERTMLEEACRAPIVLAFNVRKEILKQRDGTWLDRPKVWYHPCNEEMRLLDFVGDFLHNFHNLRKLITTPLPFPLVNMAKIFLFLWIFTVPFALCHFNFKGGVTVPVSIMFLITFGFMGLEYVSIELSDPFGDDPSDFDDLGLAEICFEDIYMTIYKCDGREWAKKLRDKMLPSISGSALDDFRQRYQENWQSVRPKDVKRPSMPRNGRKSPAKRMST